MHSPLKPADVQLGAAGMLTDRFGKTEVECAAALVVRYHQVHGLTEWTPVSRRQVISLFDEDDVSMRWVANPFWRPDPNRLRDEGWISGWATPDEPGLFTPKGLSALAHPGEWKRTREATNA